MNKDLQQTITPEQAWHYKIIPSHYEQETLCFWTHDASEELKEELEFLLGSNIHLVSKDEEWLTEQLETHYRLVRSSQTTETLAYQGNSNEFLNKLIADAKQLDSSDIHIEAYEEKCRVRIRIDGKLVERYKINKEDYPALINKIKIMASLDIAEKRLPQDGRIFFEHSGLKFDIRVSVLPTLHGEKVVLRLLNNDATNIDIQTLGFAKEELSHYLEGIRRPNGILLISGPTGSGKTTTLYATLKLLNEESRNIVTIEDPIEYTLEGINQVQLKENIGLDFASSLKTFLRQDPDVIMVGEIRDPDTANMAIRASLTGHLVLSTIHTNSAWGTVGRLVDMGIPPYLIANTLNTSVAQRLVRKLCSHCKKKEEFTPELFPTRYKTDKVIDYHFVPQGCSKCHHTGYKGRLAIYEVIPIDADLGDRIKNKQLDVQDVLAEKNIAMLSDNALDVFIKGETSIDEIYPLLLNL